MSTPVTWDAHPFTAVQRPREVLAGAGILGLAFQFLFWRAALGLSFPVFVVLLVATAWWTARRHGLVPAAGAWGLGVAAVALASGVAVRAEPFTTATNGLVATGLLVIVVHGFGDDRWLRYGLRDWLLALLVLSGHEVTGAPGLVMASHRRSGDGGRAVWRHLAPVIRGIAIAVPLVLLLAALLVSADAVFAARLRDLVTTLPAVDEALGRLLLAVVAAYAVAGGLWHLLQRRDERILGDEAVPRVLGFTEASVVLVSVSALFAGFVGVQLRYFFGGATEVVAGGLTYAEYARRGFGELVVVAAVSLAVLLALAGLTRRQTSAQRWSFTALSATLTGLVLVILASAFQRLLLYEAAFGFTRLRTVVHVFMIWLGVLLVALLVLEFVERLRLFLLASICAVVGFAMTLNVVGIDALIVRHNLARAAAGAELDAAYLQQLSPDAVPALVAALPGLEPSLADDVAGILICLDTADTSDDWRSLRVADVRARAALGSVEPPAAGAVSIPCPP